MDVRLNKVQSKKAKHDLESVKEMEDKRQQDAQAKAVKCQSVDVRLKEASWVVIWHFYLYLPDHRRVNTN